MCYYFAVLLLYWFEASVSSVNQSIDLQCKITGFLIRKTLDSIWLRISTYLVPEDEDKSWNCYYLLTSYPTLWKFGCSYKQSLSYTDIPDIRIVLSENLSKLCAVRSLSLTRQKLQCLKSRLIVSSTILTESKSECIAKVTFYGCYYFITFCSPESQTLKVFLVLYEIASKFTQLLIRLFKLFPLNVPRKI